MSKKELAALCLQKLLDAKIIDQDGRIVRYVESLGVDALPEPPKRRG
jgi:hypothetical protein